MAIYTNYGRYLKAKQFKELLQNQGDTYMLFGLGNPQWDNLDENNGAQELPIAAYNTDIMTSGNNAENQFYDNNAYQYFQYLSDGTLKTECAITKGEPNAIYNDGWVSDESHSTTNTGAYMYKCRRIIPPFPCIWKYGSSHILDNIPQDEYEKYYIEKAEGVNGYRIKGTGSLDGNQINKPSETSLAIQYFTEMYIRGKALKNNLKAPVGLIGAIKCNIDFVKDIGDESSNSYIGNIDQFWYGDRYWQIVRPDDEDLDNYIRDNTNNPREALLNNQEIYPHHIIFTATVNPRNLCEELGIDQYLVPRQIGIFTRRRSSPEDEGQICYRAYENIFNFGQYSFDELYDPTDVNHTRTPKDSVRTFLSSLPGEEGRSGELLDFTLPVKIDGLPGDAGVDPNLPEWVPGGSSSEPSDPGSQSSSSSSSNATHSYNTSDGKDDYNNFRFLLNDCIRGQARERHSVDRFGYVVGF